MRAKQSWVDWITSPYSINMFSGNISVKFIRVVSYSLSCCLFKSSHWSWGFQLTNLFDDNMNSVKIYMMVGQVKSTVNRDRWWLAVESKTSVSFYLRLVDWMHMPSPKVCKHNNSHPVKCYLRGLLCDWETSQYLY